MNMRENLLSETIKVNENSYFYFYATFHNHNSVFNNEHSKTKSSTCL